MGQGPEAETPEEVRRHASRVRRLMREMAGDQDAWSGLDQLARHLDSRAAELEKAAQNTSGTIAQVR